MEEKYYWISYQADIKIDEVTTTHPFECINLWRGSYTCPIYLLNWKEISKEEYDLFSSINYGEI